jgi:sporulation protein YlmC with PRC-barrel domain
MLRSAREIVGYRVEALDAEFGDVEDFYFDDHSWKVRYIVVATGKWLPRRMVLISPEEAGDPDRDREVLPVALTKKEVEDSPPVAAEEVLSRSKEAELVAYYGWAEYWGRLGSGGFNPPEPVNQETDEEPHLRSMEEVEGYRVSARDGQVGKVHDFIIDTDEWAVRYIVVETGDFLSRRHVVLSPHWIRRVHWAKHDVHVDLDAGEIEESPECDHHAPIDRGFEHDLHEHYDMPKYWQTPEEEPEDEG